ncbi:hypothetical protein CW306_24890 [Bacillus sp. BA3]|nr:hypothetical protein CW306_24890 [Bacillus sp. BA3]CAH0314733.1 hypothetical protein SRABI134_05241 [Peribacillus sp. Bi134]
MTMEDMKYSQTNVLTKQIIKAWRFFPSFYLAANQHSYLTEPCKVISYSTLLLRLLNKKKRCRSTVCIYDSNNRAKRQLINLIVHNPVVGKSDLHLKGSQDI